MNKERFRAILLMLSAPQPGEVFNAVQMLGKFLKENGYDWYGFAAKVTEDFKGIKETKKEEPSPSKKSTRRKTQPEIRWYRAQSGNLVGVINGQRCTIFKSKEYGSREYIAVINLEDEDTKWERGFNSEEQAQEFMVDNYG